MMPLPLGEEEHGEERCGRRFSPDGTVPQDLMGPPLSMRKLDQKVFLGKAWEAWLHHTQFSFP